MPFVEIGPTGEYLSGAYDNSHPRRVYVENVWEFAPGEVLEMSEGTPTGRVFKSLHTSESLKAEVLERDTIIAVRHYVEDLSSDRGLWTAAEAEIEATYHLLISRNIEIDCNDDATSGYQTFIGLLLSESIINQTTHDDIVLGTLLRDINP